MAEVKLEIIIILKNNDMIETNNNKKMIEACPNDDLKLHYRATWQWASHILVLRQENYPTALQSLSA